MFNIIPSDHIFVQPVFRRPVVATKLLLRSKTSEAMNCSRPTCHGQPNHMQLKNVYVASRYVLLHTCMYVHVHMCKIEHYAHYTLAHKCARIHCIYYRHSVFTLFQHCISILVYAPQTGFTGFLFTTPGHVSDDSRTSGITTAETVAAIVAPVLLASLTAGLIVVMVSIHLHKRKKTKSVNCHNDYLKILQYCSYRSWKIPNLALERVYVGLFKLCNTKHF